MDTPDTELSPENLRTLDDGLALSIRRQLRAIKVMLGFFMFMIIAMLVILGFIAWKVVTFTQDVTQRINSIQDSTRQSLDIRDQICSNDTFSGLVGNNSDICR